MEGLAGEKGEKVKILTTEPDSHPKNFLSDIKVLIGGSEDIIRSRGGKKTAFHHSEVEKMVVVFQVACKSV